MENASKALLMTASMLIGVVLLSIGIYLVNSYKNFSKTYSESMEAQRLEQFNSEFTALSTRNNVSMHEILTLTNYANEFNFINDLETTDNQFIKVNIKIGTKTINLTDLDKELKSKIPTYRNNSDKFISDLLDGTYITSVYSDIKDGRYQYNYNEDTKEKTYYNCYECTEYHVNSNTGRVDLITFTYQKEVKSKY